MIQIQARVEEEEEAEEGEEGEEGERIVFSEWLEVLAMCPMIKNVMILTRGISAT